jgi:amino acid transporter
LISRIRELLIGSPLPTMLGAHKRLNKAQALAAFSPDALSSIAYANQEIYLGLVVAGLAGLQLMFSIGLAITALLAIVALSYYQTIQAYPSGGGSYVVARNNLGTIPGLIAGSALLVGYLLTAAVSLTAGVEAIASAFPALLTYRVEIALTLLVVITLINLRGVQETGTLMAVPVYLFLFTFLPLLAYGFIRLFIEGGVKVTSPTLSPVPVTLFLILHTFATGCTALTGIEAISNGVPVFKPPESKNAGYTLAIMAILMGILFLGSLTLIQSFGITVNPGETILSGLARSLLGDDALYILTQFSTMLILAFAANTSFAGFPRLAAILAQDGFLPRQFTDLGDRLVFSNGILILALATAGLIILFNGNSHSLIPLFAIGVFMAFTLSQSGMVLHWNRVKGRGWVIKTLINGLGALTTFGTVLVIGISKFTEGAWITIFIIPLIVFAFIRIRLHYRKVSQGLTLRGLPPSLKPLPPPRVIIPVSGVHRGIITAVNYALSISKHVTAVYVELEPGAGEKMRDTWERWWPDVELVVVPSPYRSVIGPLLDYLDQIDQVYNDGQLATVIIPEFVPAKWYQGLLHNQTAWMLKAALLYRRRSLGYQQAIIDIPYHLKE